MTTPRSPGGRQLRRLTATEVDLERIRQRALLIGTGTGAHTQEEADASLDELALLADTAGADTVEAVLQRRRTPDPATYIGKGKAEELRDPAHTLDVDVVIVDDELTPAQQRNLENLFKVDVVDRVALILDIFAQHATSQDGAVQVELAQLRYRLPRLRGRGTELSQQGGGIGTRGPGETQLEVDRRRLLRRIQRLERDIKELGATRAIQRRARRRRSIPTVALVGYTNAGKSSWMRALTGSQVLVENKLFATLDTTVRALFPEVKPRILVSDTVGFIKKLPHDLVASFKSTLDEALEASLLVYVVDAADPNWESQLAIVREVLAEIGAENLTWRLLFNKVDRLTEGEREALARRFPDAWPVSSRDPAHVARVREHLIAFFESFYV
jgi:GTPase